MVTEGPGKQLRWIPSSTYSNLLPNQAHDHTLGESPAQITPSSRLLVPDLYDPSPPATARLPASSASSNWVYG